jgi:hypothetical protein
VCGHRHRRSTDSGGAPRRLTNLTNGPSRHSLQCPRPTLPIAGRRQALVGGIAADVVAAPHHMEPRCRRWSWQRALPQPDTGGQLQAESCLLLGTSTPRRQVAFWSLTLVAVTIGVLAF